MFQNVNSLYDLCKLVEKRTLQIRLIDSYKRAAHGQSVEAIVIFLGVEFNTFMKFVCTYLQSASVHKKL